MKLSAPRATSYLKRAVGRPNSATSSSPNRATAIMTSMMSLQLKCLAVSVLRFFSVRTESGHAGQ